MEPMKTHNWMLRVGVDVKVSVLELVLVMTLMQRWDGKSPS